MSNNKKVNEFYTVLCRLRDVSSTINALDSVFVLAPALFFYLAGASTNLYTLIFASIGTAGVCCAYLYVVEYGQNKLGTPTFEGIFGKYSQHVTDATDKKNVKYLYRSMLFLLVLLGVSSVGTSVYLRDSTAHILTEKPNITNVDSLKGKTDKSISDISKPIQDQIKELKKEKENVKYNVLAGQSAQMRELYNNGHTWAKEQVNPIIKARKTKIEKQIEEKQDILNKTITVQQGINSTTLTGAISTNNFNIQSFETMRAGLSTFTLLVSIFSYLIFVITSLIAGFYRAANLGGAGESKKLFSFPSPTPSVNGSNSAPNMATVNQTYNHRQVQALIENGFYNATNNQNAMPNKSDDTGDDTSKKSDDTTEKSDDTGVPNENRYVSNISDDTTEKSDDTGVHDSTQKATIQGVFGTCELCGKDFLKNHKKHRFCSDNCRKANWKNKTGVAFNLELKNKERLKKK